MQSSAERQETENLATKLRVAWQMVRGEEKEIRLVDGRLRAGAIALDGNDRLVDHVHDLVGGMVTVFRGTTRVATTIKFADGTRAVGTPLAPGPAYDAVVTRHTRFAGVVNVLGTPYFTTYDPILSPTGEFIGILFVGEKLSLFEETFNVTRDRVLIGTGVAVLVIGLGFSVLAAALFRPLHGLIIAMRGLADDKLDVPVPGLGRGDEIGGMAAAVQIFKERMIIAAALGEEREHADRELHLQAVRFGAALSTMSEVLCLFDAADRLVVGNDRLATLLDLPVGTISQGMAIQDMGALLTQKHGPGRDNARTLYDLILDARDAGRREARTLDMENGHRISVNFAPMDHEGWLVTLEDITEQRKSEARIAHMAHYDALTGLANRVLFRDRLQAAMARCGRGERCAVLYLDLDHFKSVNDTLGHPVGDALLQRVTERLIRCVRESDTIARLGGDEFAIVQTIDQPQDSATLAIRVIKAVSAPYELEGSRVVIGTSIGIAEVPENGTDADEMIRNADMALYRSKADGRGRFCFFEPEMNARMQTRRTLDLDLRKALAEGEFRVFYQPLVNIATHAVCGFEALVRWQHPDRGMVSPADFIPLAEETGLIVPLGNWVLRQACADAIAWADHLKVAVNLSPLELGGPTLIADVAAALADSGLPARRLELEITETAMLADTEGVLAILHQLLDMGIRIALDDFGTGYSSLSYLQRFPFSKVKIDRSFVSKLDQGGSSATIIAAVIDLCSRLGMVTTGEGVETETQLHHLAVLRCTEAQGYLFSKPRPADEVPVLLTRLAALETID